MKVARNSDGVEMEVSEAKYEKIKNRFTLVKPKKPKATKPVKK